MSRWLRILVTCLCMAAFLTRNTTALGECHHDDDGDVAILTSATSDDPEREEGDRSPTPSPGDSPCQAPGGCVHCTIAKMPCAAADTTPPMMAPCLGDVRPEVSRDYAPPPTGRLIRPPR
jgi:hypothetical protein